MSSTYSPWYKRKILYRIPGLFKTCPEGNYHWWWHQRCLCCDAGGADVYLFATGKHYVEKNPCDCHTAKRHLDEQLKDATKGLSERTRGFVRMLWHCPEHGEMEPSHEQYKARTMWPHREERITFSGHLIDAQRWPTLRKQEVLK